VGCDSFCREHHAEYTQAEKLLEKSAQLWTQLLEDGILQELQGKEEKLHATMEDIKQQQRMMSLPKKIKTVTEMKTLQAEEKKVQVQKMT
jgi:hypothetical protein